MDFNSCFALTGIVRVRLILGGGLGEQFCLCRGCTGINIGEGFFFQIVGNKAILLGIWVDWTLAILFISYFFVQQMVVPETIIFCLYSNYTAGGDLDLTIFSYRFWRIGRYIVHI